MDGIQVTVPRRNLFRRTEQGRRYQLSEQGSQPQQRGVFQENDVRRIIPIDRLLGNLRPDACHAACRYMMYQRWEKIFNNRIHQLVTSYPNDRMRGPLYAMELKTIICESKRAFYQHFVKKSRNDTIATQILTQCVRAYYSETEEASAAEFLSFCQTKIQACKTRIRNLERQHQSYGWETTVMATVGRLLTENVYYKLGAAGAQIVEDVSHAEQLEGVPVINTELSPISMRVVKAISGAMLLGMDLWTSHWTSLYSYPMIHSLSRLATADIDTLILVLEKIAVDDVTVIRNLDKYEWGVGLSLLLGFRVARWGLNLKLLGATVTIYTVASLLRFVAGKYVDHYYGMNENGRTDQRPATYLGARMLTSHISHIVGSCMGMAIWTAGLEPLIPLTNDEIWNGTETDCVENARRCRVLAAERLGMNTSATDEGLRRRYRKLSSKFHPDRNTSNGAGQEFIEITKAKEKLDWLKRAGKLKVE